MKKWNLMLLWLSILNMPQYALMGLNKQDSEYDYGPKYARGIWQGSQHAGIIYSILNMPKYAWESHTGF